MEIGGVVNPIRVQMAIGLIWVVYTGLVVGLTLVPSCSPSYVTTFILMYIPLLLTIVWGVYYNVSIAPCIIPKGSDTPLPPANDLDFSKIANTLPPAAFVIGIICSLLGIGGGELFGPLMLSYGILPQVSSATTSMLSLLNTGSNVVRSGGAVGRQFGLYVSTRYGRPSVIILSLVVALYVTCLYYIYDLATIAANKPPPLDPPLVISHNILIAISIMWACYTALVIALVTVTQCSTTYAVIFVFMYIPLVSAILYGSVTSTSEEELMALINPNDFDFKNDSYTLASMACVIGVICTLLGVGG
eukprot:gene29346-36382_t